MFSYVKNPKWSSIARNGIDVEVMIIGTNEFIPFHATPDDIEVHGQELYADLIAGEFGNIAEPDDNSLVVNARIKRQLLNAAERVITPLLRAEKLGMITDDEAVTLEAWERYSVLLSRVEDAEWPEKPV